MNCLCSIGPGVSIFFLAIMQPLVVPRTTPTKALCCEKLIGYFLHWGLFGALSVQVCE